MTIRRFDVVVAGGGPAGLSAALALGRARRRVLVVDAGRPANAVATGVGGLVGHAADAPVGVLRDAAAAQLRELDSVTVWRGRSVTRADRADGGEGFVVDVAPAPRAGAARAGDGAHRADDWAGEGRDAGAAFPRAGATRVEARALLLASGLRYVPPPLPGLQPLWGRSVFHCPFCDGWEVRDHAIAVHADGATAVRRGLLLRGWSDDVLVVGRMSVADRAELLAAGVRVRCEPIARLEAHDATRGRLRGIRFQDGSFEPVDALFVAPRLERHDGLAERLGCAPHDEAPALLRTDDRGRTSVAGVWAAGDLADPARSVPAALGSGARVGRALALDLMRTPEGGAVAAPRMLAATGAGRTS